MGDRQSVCKEARKRLRKVEPVIDRAAAAWGLSENGEKKLLVYKSDVANEVRDEALELKGILSTVNTELEKDSNKREFYQEKQAFCEEQKNFKRTVS